MSKLYRETMVEVLRFKKRPQVTWGRHPIHQRSQDELISCAVNRFDEKTFKVSKNEKEY